MCNIIAIECQSLPDIENGVISYTTDMTANYTLGTMATYICNAGFALDFSATNSSASRTCENDDGVDTLGVWRDAPPACVCKLFTIIM